MYIDSYMENNKNNKKFKNQPTDYSNQNSIFFFSGQTIPVIFKNTSNVNIVFYIICFTLFSWFSWIVL